VGAEMTKGRDEDVYDDLTTYVRERSGGDLVAVMVIGGEHGSGFSVQTSDPVIALNLPSMLRSIADEMEHATMRGRRKIGR